MRDFTRLREHIGAALLAMAIPFGCGPSSPPVEEPLGNTTTDNTPTVQYSDWPARQGCGTWGQWCGPVEQVSEAAGSGSTMSCAQTFQHEDLYFSMDDAATQAKRQGGDEVSCCYSYNDGCAKGRLLLDRGEAKVAPAREGAWSRVRATPAADLPAALREELARGWLEDALVEHASVAAFARATLELMALGAPPELLADCQRAGLDEVRHAEGCFALAERYGGRRLAPGPLPALAPRDADLARLAVDTFVEGCIGETIATLAATRALAACADPEVADFLRRTIRDETRHAALAWRTVAWALRAGGAPVAAALRRAAVPPPLAPTATPNPTLLAHGRLDDLTRRDATADAWREIILPTLAQLT